MSTPENGEVVAQGIIEVPYVITAWIVDGEVKYDYYDSDVYFDTIQEAIQDFRDHAGG